MKMRRRTTAVLGIALAAATVTGLTACGPGGGGQVSEDGSGNVVVWYLPDDADFIAKVKPAFEKDNPGTTLEVVSVPEDNYVTKIDTAMLAQQPPDVVFEYEAKWIKSGRVLPVDDIMADAGVDMSVFNRVAMAECVFEGKTYCMGTLSGPVMLIYNKAMFDAAGLAYPSATEPMTIDQFAETARALTVPDPDINKQVYGGLVSGPRNGILSWDAFFGADGKSAVGNLDSDRTIHFFDVMSQLSREGVNSTPAVSELKPDSDVLATGNAAMSVTDLVVAARAMDEAGLPWGAAPPPVIEAGDEPYGFVGTDKYSALKGGKNNLGAEKFLVWLAKNGSKVRMDIGMPPLDSTLLPEWAGDSEGRQQSIEVQSVIQKGNIFVPQYWTISEDFADVYTQLANGEETDAAAALKELAPKLQDKLDAAWADWDAIK